MEIVDPELLFAARCGLRASSRMAWKAICCVSITRWRRRHHISRTTWAPRGVVLRNLCLGYLNELDSPEYRALARQRFDATDNMTDQFAALSVLITPRARRRSGAGRLLRALAGRGARR